MDGGCDRCVTSGCVVGSHPGALEGFESELEQDASHGSDSYQHLDLLQSLDSSHGDYQLSDLERGTEVAEHVAHEQLTPEEEKTELEWRLTPEQQPSTAFHQPLEPLESLQTVEPDLTTVGAIEENESQKTVQLEPKESNTTASEQKTTKRQETMEPQQTVELTTKSTRTMERTEELEPEDRTMEPLTPRLESVLFETGFTGLWTGDGGNPDEGPLRKDSSLDYTDRISDEYDARNSGIDGDEDADENVKWNTDGIYRGGPPVENKKATTVPRSVYNSLINSFRVFI